MDNKVLIAGAGVVLTGVATYFLWPRGKDDTIPIPPDSEDRVAELESEGLSHEEAVTQAIYESTQAQLDESQQIEEENQEVISDLYNEAAATQQDSTEAIQEAVNDPTDAEKAASAAAAAAAAAQAIQDAADLQKLIVQEKMAALSKMLPSIASTKTACDTAAKKVADKFKFITDIETKRGWAGWLDQDANFRGSRFGIYNGDRIPKLGDVWKNDSVSSIQVKGYYKVTLYQDSNYGGSAFPIYSDDGSDIRIANLGSVWRNDSASSLTVEPHTNYLRNELTLLKTEAVSIGSLARDTVNAVNIQIESLRRAAADLALLNLYQSVSRSANSLILTVSGKLSVLSSTIDSINSKFGG